MSPRRVGLTVAEVAATQPTLGIPTVSQQQIQKQQPMDKRGPKLNEEERQRLVQELKTWKGSGQAA